MSIDIDTARKVAHLARIRVAEDREEFGNAMARIGLKVPQGRIARTWGEAQEIAEFTGISSPYEAPESPEVHIKTDKTSQEEAVDLVLSAIDKVLQGKGDDWEV